MNSDAELISRIQAADAEALAELYRRYLPPLWRYVHAQLSGDPHTAEDIVSETFLAAIDAIGDLRPECRSVYAWLVSIAKHKLIDRARRARRVANHAPNVARAAAARPEANPAAILAQAEQREILAAALSELDHEAQLALQWKYVDGFSVQQIAQYLGRSQESVAALLYRSRSRLRARLSPPPAQTE